MTAQEYIIRSKKLFEEWKEKQRQEPDEQYNKYKFGNVKKTSFLPDGIIDPDKYFSADKKVLFIAKEANWGGNDEENEISSQEDEFWLRIVVNKEQYKDGNIIYNESKFSKGLAMLYNAYINNSFDTPDYSHEGLKNVAFINLNKRGGYSYCSYSTLKGYAQEYGKLIAQQIDLINPDIIICCGTNLVSILNDYVTSKTCKAKIIGVYHPSYYGVSKLAHLKMLECALNNKPIEKTIESSKASCTKSKRGIIFDTNQSYNDAAVEEMLGTCQPCVAAFEKATKYIEQLNIGDVIFYYHKGAGIIAVGEVTGSVIYNEYAEEKRRSVKLIAPPVRNENGYLGVKVDSSFKKRVKNKIISKNFWLKRTMKTPYLYGNEIDKAFQIVKQKLYGDLTKEVI